MKKVLIIINNAYSYAGTENICNFMTDAIGDKSIVDLISLNGEGETFYPYSKVNKITNLNGMSKKFAFIRSRVNDYDFVFVVSMGKLSFLIMWLVIFLNRKDVKYISCEHVSLSSFPWWVKKLKLFALKGYNKVIVLTDEDYYKLKSKRISVEKIPNPIKYHNFQKECLNRKILAVGRLEEQKNFSELIDICGKFFSKKPGYQLLIAGEGKLRKELSDKIMAENLQDNIILLGKVNNIEDYYKECDFLVMTSLYEGLPLALLESKAWSLPVIAYDCPTGPKEIIKNGEDGFLVSNRNGDEFLDKMLLLAGNDELTLKMSKNTVSSHMDFDYKIVSDKWLSIIS